MYDQNQNIQPDYSFITNQAGPPVKKSPKPLYVFAGVIGVFFLLIGLIVVSSRNNVKKVADGPKFDTAAQVPEQYLRYVNDSQYPEAFKLFTTESQNLTTEETFVKMAPVVLANIDIAQCVLDESAPNVPRITYICPTKSSQTRLQVVFDVVEQDDTYRINRYDIERATAAEGDSDDSQS